VLVDWFKVWLYENGLEKENISWICSGFQLVRNSVAGASDIVLFYIHLQNLYNTRMLWFDVCNKWLV